MSRYSARRFNSYNPIIIERPAAEYSRCTFRYFPVGFVKSKTFETLFGLARHSNVLLTLKGFDLRERPGLWPHIQTDFGVLWVLSL